VNVNAANVNNVDNKEIIRNFFETVVNNRNIGALPQFVAADGTCGGKVFREMAVDPDPTRIAARGVERLVPSLGPSTEPSDVADFRDFTAHVLQAFPDMKVNIQSIIAEGDTVVVRWTATGTHRGELLGTRATGRVVPMTNVDIFTLKDGKIVSVQSHPDATGVLQALGHLPSTPLVQALGQRNLP